MSCGQWHCLAISNPGALYSWGSNMYGQLGIGNLVNQPGPVRVTFFDKMYPVHVTTGADYSLVLDGNSEVWTFGRNHYGQLGLGHFLDVTTPSKVVNLAGIRIRTMSAGIYHSVLLTQDGTVYTFGYNNYGQLGISSIGGNSTVPVLVDTALKFEFIKSGYDHVLARSGNILYSWGRNDVGQLGIGDNSNVTVSSPIRVPLPQGPLLSISTKGHANFVILESRVAPRTLLYGWGSNNYGQLGLGTKKNMFTAQLVNFDTVNVTGVVAGPGHTFITLSTGEIYSFGWNQHGQLASMDFNDKSYPFLYFAQKNIPIENIVLGMISTFVKSADGSVYVCGGNVYGAVGIGKFENRADPTEIQPFEHPIKSISAAYSHTVIMGFDGNIWTFGLNHRGQLGQGDPVPRLAPTPLRSLQNITKISTGLHFTLALSSQGIVWACGANDAGQLGVLDFNDRWGPVKMNGLAGLVITDMSCGQYHTLLLNDKGEVFSTGRNEAGQLGLGHIIQQSIPRKIPEFDSIREISAGTRHSLILHSSGQVYAFGTAVEGYLGIWAEPPTNSTSPYQSIPIPVLHAPYIIASIDTAESHSLALTTEGKVLSWGDPELGKLGRGGNPYIPAPLYDRNFRGHKIIQVSTGLSHSMLISENATVYSFGSNTDGQTGLGGLLLFAAVPTEVVQLSGQRVVRVTSFARHSVVLVHNTCFGTISYDPTVCSGTGACTGIDKCTCDPNYLGDLCDRTQCFGVLSNNVTVCGGNGNCKRPNACECFSGYSGMLCDDVSCFGVSARNLSSCSGRGSCMRGDMCSCRDGYIGKSCDDWTCNGMYRNNSKACGERGICASPNRCECQNGLNYIGVMCDQPFIAVFWTVYVAFTVITIFVSIPLCFGDIYVISKRLTFEIRSGLQHQKHYKEFQPTHRNLTVDRELTETLLNTQGNTIDRKHSRRESNLALSPKIQYSEE